MEYVTSIWKLDIQRTILTIIFILIMLYFLIVLFKNKSKLMKLFAGFISIISVFMVVVNIVQICAPTQIFTCEKHLTWEEVQEFKDNYAIIDNIGNIFEVKSKDIFK